MNARRFATCAFALAIVPAAAPVRAADSYYSPTVKGIDAVCDAYRPHAKLADVIRLARVGASGGWSEADPSAIARVQSAPDFTAGDFATIVLDAGAIVAADDAHLDGPTGRVVQHAWCFIGGKLSRATADVASTFDRSTGYRRTAYYGDDLDQPLAETISERGLYGKAPIAPPKDVAALLVPEPLARPANLPFFDAFVLERKHALPVLK